MWRGSRLGIGITDIDRHPANHSPEYRVYAAKQFFPSNGCIGSFCRQVRGIHYIPININSSSLDKMASTSQTTLWNAFSRKTSFFFWILIRSSLKFVPKGPIDNKAALAQVMTWRRKGDKLLPEPMPTQFTAYMRHSALIVPHIRVSESGQHWFR